MSRNPASDSWFTPIILLAIASFLGFGALLVLYGANSSQLIEALDLDYADLGLLGSMLSLGLGVGIVLAGPVIDRFPRRPLYIGAVFAVLAAATTLGPETTYAGLLARTVAIGFGAGFYETVLNALIVENYQEAAPRRLVFVHAAATAAACFTPLVFEFMRESNPLPWYEAFRLVGASHALLIALALLVPMHASPRHAEAGAGAGPAATHAARPGDRIALAAICVTTFAYVGVESAVSLFVVDHTATNLELGATRAARTISAFWGGLLVGRLAVGLSPRPLGPGTTAILAGVAAVVVTLFGLGHIHSPEFAMGATGFFLGGVFPVMIGLAGLALPTSAGTAVGLAGGLGSLGGFIVPWVTGRVAASVGLGQALASLALWLAALVLAAAYVRSRQRWIPSERL